MTDRIREHDYSNRILSTITGFCRSVSKSWDVRNLLQRSQYNVVIIIIKHKQREIMLPSTKKSRITKKCFLWIPVSLEWSWYRFTRVTTTFSHYIVVYERYYYFPLIKTIKLIVGEMPYWAFLEHFNIWAK